MSRIAKLPIKIPTDVSVAIGEDGISVGGPNGELRMCVHTSVDVVQANDTVICRPKPGVAGSLAQAGTARSLIANMITGVRHGFERELQLVGVGYRAQLQDGMLNLSLGFSHVIKYRCPEDVSIETPSQTRIVVRGADKQRVGQTAAEIRAYRPPEPYKGKGVRFTDEHIARKEAKKKQKQ
jgi:large subunit ribosomal protein L6